MSATVFYDQVDKAGVSKGEAYVKLNEAECFFLGVLIIEPC
jgi:hypothetical protein